MDADGIHTVQSGAPLTFLMGDDVALTAHSADQHAQLRPGVTRRISSWTIRIELRWLSRFFNTDAFVPTNQCATGTYGNAGRGLISGPAFNSSDLPC